MFQMGRKLEEVEWEIWIGHEHFHNVDDAIANFKHIPFYMGKSLVKVDWNGSGFYSKAHLHHFSLPVKRIKITIPKRMKFAGEYDFFPDASDILMSAERWVGLESSNSVVAGRNLIIGNMDNPQMLRIL